MRCLFWVLLCLVLVSSSACQATQQYRVEYWGPGLPYSINDLGQVTGRLDIGNEWHAFICTSAGTVDLGGCGMYNDTQAFHINNKGQIVGAAYCSAYGYRATFMWDPATGYHILGGSSAQSINDNGWIVGSTFSTGNVMIWGSSTKPPTLQGFMPSPADVNDKNQIAGVLDDQAVLWEPDGSVTYIPRVTDTNIAEAINNNGEVAGISYNGYAWRWSKKSGLSMLPRLPGSGYAQVTDINDRGQIVGTSGRHVVVWNPDGTMVDLSAIAGIDYTMGMGINNKGQVVGTQGNYVIVWTPVPEPSSLLMLISGTAGVLLLRRRRLSA